MGGLEEGQRWSGRIGMGKLWSGVSPCKLTAHHRPQARALHLRIKQVKVVKSRALVAGIGEWLSSLLNLNRRLLLMIQLLPFSSFSSNTVLQRSQSDFRNYYFEFNFS